MSVRGSVMRQRQRRAFGLHTERGIRSTGFGETSFQGARGHHTWVAGAAFQQDRYRPQDLPAFRYTFSTPAAFAQDEIVLGQRVILSLSGRIDCHSAYGALATPRVSLLSRPRDGWILRVSAGTGAFAPTPFTEETEEVGFSRLAPLRDLRAERARGGSVDVTRTLGALEVTATAFASHVRQPVRLRELGGSLSLVNAVGPTRSWGTELLARYRAGAFIALATHAWTRLTEADLDDGARREVPLTPTHTASLNLMWEAERTGRFGIEAYYVGRQTLEDNPYRATGRPQLLIGALIERRVGRARLFANSENLFDVRQTKDDPLVRPRRASDGSWTVDAWAPLEGRVLNAGVRVAW